MSDNSAHGNDVSRTTSYTVSKPKSEQKTAEYASGDGDMSDINLQTSLIHVPAEQPSDKSTKYQEILNNSS